jgi:hypothetical protein
VGGDEAQRDRVGGGARAARSGCGNTGDEEADPPPQRHKPSRGGAKWPTSGAMADEPHQARGMLGAEAGDRVGEAGSRGRVGLDGGECRGWRLGPVSHAGLGEGAGGGEPRRGQVATATTRQWSGAWGSDEASGNGGGLERTRESKMRKKGEASH